MGFPFVRSIFLAAAASLMLWAGGVADATAGCRQVCSGGSDCNDLSGDARWRCIRGPSSGGCRTVCADGWGAIAFSAQTGAWGYSFDHDSRGRADRVALGHCGRRAPDCRIVTSFVNACGALAVQGRTAAGGTGKSRAEAEAASLAACRATAGGGCAVTAWACNAK
ncbi:MAG: DUF4189 domain-containing protein [Alphaproteobacteria bacterium]|nr:DUF4189 domain-containing protein [Alphaproteobacteria bacterium]